MSQQLLAFQSLTGFEARHVCVGAPDWFSKLLEENDGERPGDPVLVLWERQRAALSDLQKYQAVVGINCGRLSDEMLRRAGFAYVRRFAVLPSLIDARWFIPLDSPKIAAAALSLYKPIRATARLQHGAATAAARIGFPFWYKDEIWIARRVAPAIETTLQELFPERQFRLALSTSAPSRVSIRKVLLAVTSTAGEMLGFAKMAVSEAARVLVRHEADVLVQLAGRDRIERLEVPRLLFGGEVNGAYLSVQSWIHGPTAPARLTSSQRTMLAALRGSATKAVAATTFVRTLRERVEALESPYRYLADAVVALLPALERLETPQTIVHGDFAPWNLRVRGDITGAFDWEHGELDGPPLIDECNHLLLVGRFFEGWTVDRAFAALEQMARENPLGLSPAEVAPLQQLYVLQILTKLAGEGMHEEPIAKWFRELLARLEERRSTPLSATLVRQPTAGHELQRVTAT